jgi:hypothetical protein
MTQDIINGIRVLRPAEGLKITNQDRTFYGEEVWLGKEDSPANYFEEVEPEQEENP